MSEKPLYRLSEAGFVFCQKGQERRKKQTLFLKKIKNATKQFFLCLYK